MFQLADIAKMTAYRTVLYTGQFQVTVQHLMPNEYIPSEVHDVDQLIQIVSGRALITVNGITTAYVADSIIPIMAGQRHEVRPMPGQHLTLLSTYAAPQHPNKVVERGPTY